MVQKASGSWRSRHTDGYRGAGHDTTGIHAQDGEECIMETFTPEMKNLLIQRLEERYNQGRLAGVYTLGQYYSPEQILEEARQGTSAGEEFLMAEKRFMDELKRRM